VGIVPSCESTFLNEILKGTQSSGNTRLEVKKIMGGKKKTCNNTDDGRQKKCYNCDGIGHFSNKCPHPRRV
jgi:hypothetical protein